MLLDVMASMADWCAKFWHTMWGTAGEWVWYHLHASIEIKFALWLMLSRFQKVKIITWCLISHFMLLIWVASVYVCSLVLEKKAHVSPCSEMLLLLLWYLLEKQLESDFINFKSPCSLTGIVLLFHLSLFFLMPKLSICREYGGTFFFYCL